MSNAANTGDSQGNKIGVWYVVCLLCLPVLEIGVSVSGNLRLTSALILHGIPVYCEWLMVPLGMECLSEKARGGCKPLMPPPKYAYGFVGQIGRKVTKLANSGPQFSRTG